MADLAITAAAVDVSEGTPDMATWTEAVTAGEVVSANADWEYSKADANDSALIGATNGLGIALTSGSNRGLVLREGKTVTVNAVLTVGQVYYLSSTPGKICPEADVAIGMYLVIIGYAISTTELFLLLNSTGVLKV